MEKFIYESINTTLKFAFEAYDALRCALNWWQAIELSCQDKKFSKPWLLIAFVKWWPVLLLFTKIYGNLTPAFETSANSCVHNLECSHNNLMSNGLNILIGVVLSYLWTVKDRHDVLQLIIWSISINIILATVTDFYAENVIIIFSAIIIAKDVILPQISKRVTETDMRKFLIGDEATTRFESNLKQMDDSSCQEDEYLTQTININLSEFGLPSIHQSTKDDQKVIENEPKGDSNFTVVKKCKPNHCKSQSYDFSRIEFETKETIADENMSSDQISIHLPNGTQHTRPMISWRIATPAWKSTGLSLTCNLTKGSYGSKYRRIASTTL